jgi:UDP-2,3-diacylglucosamine hydrolase
LNAQSKYVNLGDWIGFNSYAVFDGSQLQLNTFEEQPTNPTGSTQT